MEDHTLIESLYINSFGGINDCTIETGKFSGLIGPQSSGKSVIAKLFYFFQKFYYFSIPAEIATGENIKTDLTNSFKQYFPEQTWPSCEFEVAYTIRTTNEKTLKIQIKKIPKQKLKITFSKELEHIIKTLKREHNQATQEILKQRKTTNIEIIIDTKLNELMSAHLELPFRRSLPIFIPAGRSFFALLENNIFSFLTADNRIDPILAEFGRIYEISKQNLESAFRAERVTTKMSHTLRGIYFREQKKDYLSTADRRKTPVVFASSGQQEILPICAFVQMVSNWSNLSKGEHTIGSIFIEEPEAHLFPESQKNITELIVEMFNKSKYKTFITTHSPYVIMTLNNLLFAHSVGEAASEIVSLETHLNPNGVNIYTIESGCVKSIIEKETNLIDALAIDQTSSCISNQFNKLLELA